MTATIQADIEQFLTDYLRREIGNPALTDLYPVMLGFEVTNREPPEDSSTFPPKLIVVRDDGTTPSDVGIGDTSIGVSVLMGGPTFLRDSSLAARVVHALIRVSARVEAGNPVAAVTLSNGPFAVQESQPRARWYSTHTLVTVETPLGIDIGTVGGLPEPGADSEDYTIQLFQTVASSSWSFNVPDGFADRAPAVDVYDVNGEPIWADVIATKHLVTVQFPEATLGSVVLT